MRVVVVGATGNAGSAVLEELSIRTEVTSILGLARRLPDAEVEPFCHAEWDSVDIQSPDSTATLAELFSGADAVIHLAWLIQPNSQRELLRRVNVNGTEHVLKAAAEAGVRRIAVASSVGAYSPVDDDHPRDESWGTEGIAGSHYSEDKAAQERVMDAFEAAHPEIALARLRPGLIFQAAAGSEIQRYFLGKLAPVQLLNTVRPPMVPMPNGIRVQAVHARDVARAYAEAIIRGARGAFNIASDDVLTGEALASIISGRSGKASISVPFSPLKPLVKSAHRARLLPTDEGWLEMARHSPIMDTSRARSTLGWSPELSGADALNELLEAMGEGEGRGSIPLRPRSESSLTEHPLPAQNHQLPPGIDTGLLRSYMADHLAGATAGLKRIQAMAAAFEDTPVYPQLSQVAEAIGSEHQWLSRLIQSQGFPRPAVAAPALWVGERLSRAKPYARPLKRSPAALVLETELMLGAVTAKRQGWEVLSDYAEELGVDRSVFDQLIEAADDQREHLDQVHAYARPKVFRRGRSTFSLEE
ncbi:NAD-dependent epimerase/dehydratase family protein [Nesterenkonia natronophila]|uniref:NAD-dependent epimerase/dehydratase family protein n=1 Tax=Nesterenkonia natronophila TaxID=2174932 RepID=A0A3A4F431_9MICC|nr:NAD-dependent epimerase/dehydratase family protein [Nesterenkonia natronophila]RJN31240.1 NAD-dependent epimerase/dehydratase family protein [Nesterenkonia natronophila]